MRTAIIFLLAVGAVFGTVEPILGQASDQAGAATVKALGQLPLYFVENRGVYPDEVRYYIQGADKTLFFTDSGITIALKGRDHGWTVKLDFVGANEHVRPVGVEKQEAVFSYFTGPERDWKAGLPTFAKVVYRDLWPGIDLVYNGTVNKLKYEFVVAPGGDPSRIRLRYRGAKSVALTDAESLRIETPEGSFEDAAPLAWQENDGERVPVAMAYAVDDDGRFGFEVGDYDRSKPLVLDPAVIVYCGYIGGSLNDYCFGVAVDGQGNVYVCGQTDSGKAQGFPVKVGPDQTYNGTIAKYPTDAFVAKVNAAGTALVYCGYIGGNEWDQAFSVAVDGSGCAYVCGQSRSSQVSFPVKKGPFTKRSSPVGTPDAFVAKVDAAGKALLYCGYIGGTKAETALDIALGPKGAAYVAGRTRSSQGDGFPVKNGPDLTYNGGITDVFVAKVPPSGIGVDYCGFVGGAKDESWFGKDVAVAVDGNGCAYLAGWTTSDQASFPVAVGPDLTYAGNSDAFVAKVNAAGTALVYCGYIGGSGIENPTTQDLGYGIAVDAAGNAYVAGATGSSPAQGFPVRGGPGKTFSGGCDVFVAMVSSSGKTLAYCGYIGGSQWEDAMGIVLDRQGNAYVAGSTWSKDFPVLNGPDSTFNGGREAYLAKVTPLGQLAQCGYIGGAKSENAYDLALDPVGNAYVVGFTESDENSFPVRIGPALKHQGGPSPSPSDGFVAKIAYQDGLIVAGTPRPGATVTLNLAAFEARGLPYQLATSFMTGFIPVGTRSIGLGVDDLYLISVSGLWPHAFQGYTARLDSQGRASARIVIPNQTLLIGVKTYSAFVTLDPSWPSGIRSISETRVITIVR